MEKHITGIIRRPIVSPPPPVASNIVEVLRWGDEPLLSLDGMSTAGLGVGSFQEVPLFHVDANKPTTGYFSGVSSFQRMGVTEKNYLYSIQPDDFEKYHYTIAQKMNLFIQPPPIGTPAQAYWSREGDRWNSANFTMMDFGTIVFGGQKVAVETENGTPKEYSFYSKYRNKSSEEWIPFFKIIGMRRSEMGRPVAELLAEGKIQKYTAANRGAGGQENVYTDHLRGTMYHPIWSPLDWKVNNGNNELYIAKLFLNRF